MPEEREGHARVTVHVDMDYRGTRALIDEGCTDLAALMEEVIKGIREEVSKKEPLKLDSTQSYDITFRMHLLDAAKGIEPPEPSDKVALLLDD